MARLRQDYGGLSAEARGRRRMGREVMNFTMSSVVYLVRVLLLVIVWAACVMIAHAEAPAIPLTIESAITRAIQTHLTTALAKTATQEARARAIQAAASLLPQVTGSVSQSRTFKTNL